MSKLAATKQNSNHVFLQIICLFNGYFFLFSRDKFTKNLEQKEFIR